MMFQTAGRASQALLFSGFILILGGLHSGCSSKQVYQGSQASREHECRKIFDERERAQCFEIAKTSYEQYQRQQQQKAPAGN